MSTNPRGNPLQNECLPRAKVRGGTRKGMVGKIVGCVADSTLEVSLSKVNQQAGFCIQSLAPFLHVTLRSFARWPNTERSLLG
jgi:hypothetical protein